MSWMIFLGAVAMGVGTLLIASPKTLLRMSDQLNRMVTRMDDQVIKNRMGVGVSLILAAVFLFFYAYMRAKF